MPSRREIAKMLAVFAELYPRPITEQTAGVYEMALSDLTDDQIQYATAQLVRTATFFPKPAEIREAVGANVQPAPDTAGILNRIRGLVTYHNGREYMPSVERVSEALGDAIAQAYGYVGPSRMEGVVFGGSGTGVDIAAREFATALAEAQDAGQCVALPPMRDTKQLSNANQSLFVDSRPNGVSSHIAALLETVTQASGRLRSTAIDSANV
jgi:hypothetical protein